MLTTNTPNRAESLIQKIDDWRRRTPSHIHNFGPDKHDYLHQSRTPYIEHGEGALFLLVPRHDFHEIIFFVKTIDQLPGALTNLIQKLGAEKQYRITLNYKQPDPENENDLIRACFQAGFIRAKRTTRIRVNQNQTGRQKRRQQLLSLTAHIPFTPEWACPGDEQKILNLLQEEFDPCADNLPELDEIRQNIEKQQVAIIRHEGNIIAAHYFTIKNQIYYSWYDITQKAWRGDFLFLKIELFINDYLEQHNIRLTRSHGWRDVTNKRFQREDRVWKTIWENIFTDHLVWQG